MSLSPFKATALLSFPAFSSFPSCFPTVFLLSGPVFLCGLLRGQGAGGGPLERGPWVNRRLPACFADLPGEAGPTQLLWQTVSPRGPPSMWSLHAEAWDSPGQISSWKNHSSGFLQNRLKGPRQPLALFTSLGHLRKQFPVAPSTAPFENSYPTTCSGPTMHS